MSFRLRFWGTRGSIPVPGSQTVRHGGNTPCVEVRTSGDRLIVLDAGTGIRALGESLMERAKGERIVGDVFLTHAHWDHVQGIPFFRPLYQKGNQFRMWAPRGLLQPLGDVVKGQMGSAVFPVSFDDLPALIEFCEMAYGRKSEGDFDVSATPVQHPGGAVAYRFDAGGHAFVYVSDNELGTGGNHGAPSSWKRDLVAMAQGASLLVHDATYLSSEYESHKGWGHSTPEEAIDLAIECGVKQLVLYHHMPERSDDELDRVVDGCRKFVASRGSSLSVVAAAEGMELTA